MRNIEHPFYFSNVNPIYARVEALEEVDYRRLVRILVRARLARVVGINIPMDKLLQELPI
jgi:hypothetical protein